MRLDKYLADCGVGTRSEIKKLIRSGAVAVTGVSSPAPELKIDEASAGVFVNGNKLNYRRYIYLMLNKPQGYVSATWDKHKPVVLDLVPSDYLHYEPFPLGRLDIDTVGLCILTNDGALAHRLLSPNNHIPKTYIAKVDGPLGEREVSAFLGGMDLGDFVSKPARLNILQSTISESLAEVVILEGKFHQIKRMFEKVGRRVTYLKRVSMNRLKLDESLAEGDIRELTDEELELLTYDAEHKK